MAMVPFPNFHEILHIASTNALKRKVGGCWFYFTKPLPAASSSNKPCHFNFLVEEQHVT
jgi:hypothetical protein